EGAPDKLAPEAADEECGRPGRAQRSPREGIGGRMQGDRCSWPIARDGTRHGESPPAAGPVAGLVRTPDEPRPRRAADLLSNTLYQGASLAETAAAGATGTASCR